LQTLFQTIYEDSELLAINKPAGLVCHPTKGDQYSSLISRIRLYLGSNGSSHIINRLDRETSGVVLVAKNPETAGGLGKLWQSRSVQKDYLAIVRGWVEREAGVIDFPLGKDENSIVAVKDCVRADGAAAKTEFWVERRFSRAEGQFTLIRVTPQTGRKHQIRIHLAAIGHPIVGDKLYGGDEDLYLALAQDRLTDEQRQRLILPCQALHAARVTFPWRGGTAEFRAEPELFFSQFAAA